ncbi:queuine tRNA-ribosyltransferase [Vibrio phage K394]
MKFQVEFSEITKGLVQFNEQKALMLTDKVCRGDLTRIDAINSMVSTHYHGGPMWGGEECFNTLYKNSSVLVSFSRPEQLKKVIKVASDVVLDNGAFPNWKNAKRKNLIVDWDAYWTKFYMWILAHIGSINWFVAPDVIEGTEEENDELLSRIPSSLKHKAVPVWHSVESIDRLVRLCEQWPRVAIGLCGPHEKTMSKPAQDRLEEAFKAIYIDRDIDVKIHGLRMLDGRVLGKFPLDSADSTNVSINVPKWVIKYPEIGSHIIEKWNTDRGYKFDGVKSFYSIARVDEWGIPYYSDEFIEFKADKSVIAELKMYRTAVLKGAVESVTPPTIKEWIISKK